MRIVHVGLGKTGSTMLQRGPFRELLRRGALEAFNPPPLLAAARRLALLGGDAQTREAAEAWRRQPERTLLSYEALAGWNPRSWQDACARNAAAFGPDSAALITLRAPDAHLRSVYQQKVQEGWVRPPERFFVDAGRYDMLAGRIRTGALDVLDVDAYDLEGLVESYRGRFAQVVVVSAQGVRSLGFLPALWPGLDAATLDALRRATEGRPRNVSYSARAMRLTFLREAALRRFGLRTLGGDDAALDLAFDALEGRAPPGRQRARLTWRSMMQNGLDRWLKSPPYILPDGLPQGRFAARNAAFYDRVRTAPGGFLRFVRTG